MTSRIPPTRRAPDFAPERAVKALQAVVPGAGRVSGVARPGVSEAVKAALRGRAAPADDCCGLIIVDSTEPTSPAIGQPWADTGSSCGGTTATHTESFTGSDTYPTGPIVTDGITWLANAPNHGISSNDLFFDGHDFDLTNSAGRVVFPAEGADGTMTVTGMRVVSGGPWYFTGLCWRVSSVANPTARDYYWCLRSNGNVHKVIGNTLDATVHLACGAIPDHATVTIDVSGDDHEVIINSVSAGSFTDSFNNTATGWGVIADNGGGFGYATSFDLTTTAGAGHPLKMWDGTQWWLVACMVPA